MHAIEVTVYQADKSGVLASFSGADVIRYTIDESLGCKGLPLGRVCAKRFELTLSRGAASGVELKNSFVRVRLGAEGGPMRDAGTWYASEARTEEGGFCVLSGCDALTALFEAGFTDDASAYPRTLENLVGTLCAAAGTPLANQDFHSSGRVFRRMPEWGRGISFRGALGSAAFVAGGFARNDFSGDTEIVSCRGGEEIIVGRGECTALTLSDARFCMNALLYRKEGESEYARYAASPQTADSPQNALKAECVPLADETALADLCAYLAGASFEGGEVRFFPQRLFQAGDVLVIEDEDGASHRLLVSENRITLDAGGLSAVCVSRMPAATDPAGGGGLKVFNADGTLNFEAIGEVTQRVLALSGAYIRSLTADQITAGGLLAKFIEAVRLRAASISASELTTDALTASLAEIFRASVGKLEAGTVTADALTAALIDVVALKVASLSASSVTADRLGAALARFQCLTAGSAEFDRATVTHMIASALNVSYGAAGEVFIENLAADYASIVRASVANLCVRAGDGAYYRLSVENGSVVPVRVSVSAREAEEGVTEGGKTIIETELTVSDLSAGSVKAARALINRLDASRIDADALTAREAFIESLNARDITSNSYLRLALTDADGRIKAAEDGLNRALEAQEDGAEIMKGLKRWLTIDEDGLKQGKSGSVYSTLINESGFHVKRSGKVGSVGSFDLKGLTAEGVTLGMISARKTASGGWVWDETE